MIKEWKKSVDNGKTFAALNADLFNAFDCLPHDLITATHITYGFIYLYARLIQSYLFNRKQRAKTNNPCSSWEEILFGDPQDSILGLLLFNIFICDLFSVMNNVNL